MVKGDFQGGSNVTVYIKFRNPGSKAPPGYKNNRALGILHQVILYK